MKKGVRVRGGGKGGGNSTVEGMGGRTSADCASGLDIERRPQSAPGLAAGMTVYLQPTSVDHQTRQQQQQQQEP